ncbi:MAG: alkaline phosphatase [Legionellales bacterium RIFCSPHIGHO2_12_FULL_42_9]|nr:MAG: alkaline phosphatase [Legionellales bacterium RIFCSPHIGHO2_12_FULL_42_9]
MKKILFSITFFAYFLGAMAATPTFPKLIVQIVVDQLRGDLLSQTRHEFGTDGFNYLLDHGINYQNAHHPHALTVTCVGHATIATGSTPSLHGIVANDWYDPRTNRLVYCTEDPDNPTLATSRSKSEAPGQSPRNLVASTFSDELVLAERGRAFGVSLKDRSAITLAGHAGKAFWFDKEHGGFVSSRYYYQHYPTWVDNWNAAYHPKNETWELMSESNTYRFAKVRSIQNHFPHFGDSFPHTLGVSSSSTYYKNLAMTPFADELTADFAISLLKEEKLGKTPNKSDYLAVSFSVVDIIGHHYTPNSLESEDNLKRLDKTIAKLLNTIDAEVGLKNTVIVLTADHGTTDSPNWLAENHIEPIPALNIKHLQQSMNALLLTRFKLPHQAVLSINPPYIYLNHPLLTEHGLIISEVANYLAEMLQQDPSLFAIYSLPLHHNQQDWLSKKVAKMNFPSRSGDLYIVPKAYQDITDTPDIAISHGSPWNYDSYVPLLFVNPLFKSTRITRLVYTTDIASTLTGLLAIKPPSASIGNPLPEVIHNCDKIAGNIALP